MCHWTAFQLVNCEKWIVSNMRFVKPEVSVNLKFVKRNWAVVRRNCASSFQFGGVIHVPNFPNLATEQLATKQLGPCCNRLATEFESVQIHKRSATRFRDFFNTNHGNNCKFTTRRPSLNYKEIDRHFPQHFGVSRVSLEIFFRMCLVARWKRFFVFGHTYI